MRHTLRLLHGLKYSRPTFVASEALEAQSALAELSARYPNTSLHTADVIVALGGDGFMLSTLHKFMGSGLPVFGMNRGTLGQPHSTRPSS